MLYLNRLQHRLWSDINGQSSSLHNVVYAFSLEGNLDINYLQSNLKCLLLANPIYHSRIISDGKGAFFFREEDEFVLPFEVITFFDECGEKGEPGRIIDHYARIPIKKESRYLCKFYLFHLKERQWIFMPKFHRLVMDGMSMFACEQQFYLCPQIPLSSISGHSVMERFVGAAMAHTCRPAVIYGSQYISYSELYVRAVYISGLIYREVAGTGKTKFPIGILMKHTPESIAVLLGILASGNVFVPLNTEHSKERLEYILKDCGICLLVSDEPLSWGIDGVRVLIPEVNIGQFNVKMALNARSEIVGEDTACIIYTSDFSGCLKGIPVCHYQLLNIADEQAKLFRIFPDNSRVFYFSDMGFGLFISQIFTALLAGSCLVLARDTECKVPQILLELLEQEKVTCVTILS